MSKINSSVPNRYESCIVSKTHEQQQSTKKCIIHAAHLKRLVMFLSWHTLPQNMFCLEVDNIGHAIQGEFRRIIFGFQWGLFGFRIGLFLFVLFIRRRLWIEETLVTTATTVRHCWCCRPSSLCLFLNSGWIVFFKTAVAIVLVKPYQNWMTTTSKPYFFASPDGGLLYRCCQESEKKKTQRMRLFITILAFTIQNIMITKNAKIKLIERFQKPRLCRRIPICRREHHGWAGLAGVPIKLFLSFVGICFTRIVLDFRSSTCCLDY